MFGSKARRDELPVGSAEKHKMLTLTERAAREIKTIIAEQHEAAKKKGEETAPHYLASPLHHKCWGSMPGSTQSTRGHHWSGGCDAGVK